MYGIKDLEENVIIYPPHLLTSPIEEAIEEAFREEFIYAGTDDIPSVLYFEGRQTIEIEQEEYEMSQELIEYLKDYKHQLQTKPIPEVKINAIEIKITPPEKEGEKGYIEIEMELNE